MYINPPLATLRKVKLMAVDDDGGVVGVLPHRVGCGNVTPGAVAIILGLRQ